MKKHTLLTVLVCAALLLTPVAALAESTPDAAAKTPAQIITDNTKLDMSLYEGKAVFMNFFTEWCGYCMQEMPDIKAIYQAYDPEQLQIILVHVWDMEDDSNTESIRKRFGLEEMTFFEDEDAALSRLVGLPAYPTSLFFDAEGNLSSAHASMLTYDAMAAAVEEMGVTLKENAAE